MDNCAAIMERLVLYAEGELDALQCGEVRKHLETCARCRAEAEKIGQIREWLTDPELFAPDTNYAWQQLPRRMAARAESTAQVKWWLPANLGSLGWTLSKAATILLACGAVWFVSRPVPAPKVVATAPAPGNAVFLAKMQAAYAREATARYLSECQDLLLTLMRAGRNCDNDKYDVSLEVTRARELLQRKQLLESELSSPNVAPAKPLCDELESFLVNLSTSDRCETLEKMRRMERYIREQQLLLRINLLQSELS
jgi:hypothetical protein